MKQVFNKKNGEVFKTSSSAKAASTRKIKKEGLQAIGLVIKNKEGYSFQLHDLNESIEVLKDTLRSDTTTAGTLKEVAMQSEISELKEIVRKMTLENSMLKQEIKTITDENQPEKDMTNINEREKAAEEDEINVDFHIPIGTDVDGVKETIRKRDTLINEALGVTKEIADHEEQQRNDKMQRQTDMEKALASLNEEIPNLPKFEDEYFQEKILNAIQDSNCYTRSSAIATNRILKALVTLTNDKFGLASDVLGSMIKLREIEYRDENKLDCKSVYSNKDISKCLRLLGEQDVPTLKNPEIKREVLILARKYLEILQLELYIEAKDGGQQEQYLDTLMVRQKIKISNLI